MAPMKTKDNNYSSNYGEAVVRQANVLASCYIVDSVESLKGLHYCATGANGAECPPLAAITSSNELAILPKARSGNGTSTARRTRETPSGGRRHGRRGGATQAIREECVRFFCETMRAVFCGERNMASSGSGLMMGDHYNGINMLPTPPDDVTLVEYPDGTIVDASVNTRHGNGNGNGNALGRVPVAAWLEIWDYAGGASFRGFIADAEEKALFAFFDVGVIGRDLKPALMALIELAESPLGCTKLVICIDRRMELGDAQSLMKSLRWVGFELATLDFWAGQQDAISDRWVFMQMEV